MTQSFSLDRYRCAVITDPALREEIQGYTGSAAATSRILSSIERFGSDPSIERYEMTPQQQRVSRAGAGVTWTVRAVRLVAGL